MMEGISYLAGAELPVVIVNIMRAGPGLGGILPSQSDYLQATKGGGHGDYRVLVLAPSTVQEAADLTMEAFDLADKYRNPVMILGDGLIGQMMEPVEFKRRIEPEDLPEKPWATTGARRPAPEHRQLALPQGGGARAAQLHLGEKYEAMEAEVRHETYRTDDDLDLLIVAYGTVARIARTSIDALREKGLKVGLFRPITLFPYPSAALADAASRAKHVLVAELSMGQMVEDVRAIVAGRVPVEFFGRCGGMVMTAEELAEQVEKLAAVPA